MLIIYLMSNQTSKPKPPHLRHQLLSTCPPSVITINHLRHAYGATTLASAPGNRQPATERERARHCALQRQARRGARLLRTRRMDGSRRCRSSPATWSVPSSARTGVLRTKPPPSSASIPQQEVPQQRIDFMSMRQVRRMPGPCDAYYPFAVRQPGGKCFAAAGIDGRVGVAVEYDRRVRNVVEQIRDVVTRGQRIDRMIEMFARQALPF